MNLLAYFIDSDDKIRKSIFSNLRKDLKNCFKTVVASSIKITKDIELNLLVDMLVGYESKYPTVTPSSLVEVLRLKMA